MSAVLVFGAEALAISFAADAAAQGVKERTIVHHYGQLYRTRVRARASGRPGPRAQTGDYRRSITVEFRRGSPPAASLTFAAGITARGLSGTTAEIYTDRPQARRLEFGFVGSDSLGRHYNQPPYPHWEPDLQRTIDEMHAAFEAALPL